MSSMTLSLQSMTSVSNGSSGGSLEVSHSEAVHAGVTSTYALVKMAALNLSAYDVKPSSSFDNKPSECYTSTTAADYMRPSLVQDGETRQKAIKHPPSTLTISHDDHDDDDRFLQTAYTNDYNANALYKNHTPVVRATCPPYNSSFLEFNSDNNAPVKLGEYDSQYTLKNTCSTKDVHCTNQNGGNQIISGSSIAFDHNAENDQRFQTESAAAYRILGGTPAMQMKPLQTVLDTSKEPFRGRSTSSDTYTAKGIVITKSCAPPHDVFNQGDEDRTFVTEKQQQYIGKRCETVRSGAPATSVLENEPFDGESVTHSAYRAHEKQAMSKPCAPPTDKFSIAYSNTSLPLYTTESSSNYIKYDGHSVRAHAPIDTFETAGDFTGQSSYDSNFIIHSLPSRNSDFCKNRHSWQKTAVMHNDACEPSHYFRTTHRDSYQQHSMERTQKNGIPPFSSHLKFDDNLLSSDSVDTYSTEHRSQFHANPLPLSISQ